MNYHILELASDKKTVKVVFHIPVPTKTNVASVPLRTALVAHSGGSDAIKTVLPDVATAELTAIKAGEIIEVVETVRFDSLDMTDVERLANVVAAYTIAKNKILASLQTTMLYYGFSGDVV